MTERTAAPSRRPLAGLVAAYLVSGTGTAMSAVAVPWLVLTTTGSAAATGVVGFAQMTPYVLLQATAGPLVDRLGFRRAFLLGNSAAALAVCAIPLLHALDALTLGTLAVLVAVAGAVRGMADCATTPLVPITAERGDVPLERAVGVFSGANRTAMLAGMPLAGALITAFGPAAVVLIDGLSFAAAVLVLGATVPGAAAARAAVAAERPAAGGFRLRAYVADLGEGLRFLRGDRLLLGIVTMVAVTNLLDEAFTSVLLPVWGHGQPHGAKAIGVIGAAWGLGMLIGALAGGWFAPRLPRWTTFAIASVLSGAPPFFALAASASMPVLVAVLLTSGVLGGVLNPILGAVEMERIPARLQARVLGAIKASAWIGIPFGSLLGGALAAGPGLTAALVSCGAAMLLATAAPLVLPSWRELERREPSLA